MKTKSKNVNPQPKGSLTEAVENVVQHQATGFSRSTNTSIADNSKISNADEVFQWSESYHDEYVRQDITLLT